MSAFSMQACVTSMLDEKVQASDVAMLDKYSQPSRGLSFAETQRIMRTWQFKATGTVAGAMALAEFKVERIKHGKA